MKILFVATPNSVGPRLTETKDTSPEAGKESSALQKVTGDFEYLIACREGDIKRELITQLIEPNKNKVRLILRVLSDKEFLYAINAADCIVLPYRLVHNGSSGPLGEETAIGKQ